jgi:hypothetical protein
MDLIKVKAPPNPEGIAVMALIEASLIAAALTIPAVVKLFAKFCIRVPIMRLSHTF